MAARFDVFEGEDGWRWRLWSGSRKVATSGEAFDSKSNAQRAAANVKEVASTATLPSDVAEAVRRLLAAKSQPKKARKVVRRLEP